MMSDRKLEELKDQWWKEMGNATDCQRFHTSFDGLQMNDIGGIFMLIVAGIIAACIILAIEFFWCNYKLVERPRLTEPIHSIQEPTVSCTSHNVSLCEGLSNMEAHGTHSRWLQVISAVQHTSRRASTAHSSENEQQAQLPMETKTKRDYK